MKLKTDMLRLYAVTDRRWLKEGETLAGAVEELLQGGVRMVQLREKTLSGQALYEEALALKQVCSAYHAALIINDSPALAKAVGADGVHVGLSDMSIQEARSVLGGGIVGGSAHNVEKALAAERAGADYLGCGDLFGTHTKPGTSRLSLEELGRICRAVKIPVVAIGGVTADKLDSLAGTGVAGVAMVSGLFAAQDRRTQARALEERLQRMIRR